MTEAERDPSETRFRFDIAVSFAGEDRELVNQIVQLAADQNVDVFYDEDRRVESWGEDLIEYFTRIYQHESRFAVMFISRHYAEKVWTRLERRSILARQLNQRPGYALPVRIDDTELDGLLPTVGYLDARVEGAEGIAQAIVQKVGRDGQTAGTGGAMEPLVWTAGAPTTDVQSQKLLAMRPPGWEYVYYGGLLLQGKEQLEPRFTDIEIGYARVRTVLDGREAFDYLKSATSRYGALGPMFNAVLDQSEQERAFGAPGEPGDPARIAHLARRLIDVYEQFLSISEDIKGTVVPEEFRDARDLAARVAIKPLEGIRAFIADFATQVRDFPQRLTAGEDIHLEFVATIEADTELLEQFTAALREGFEQL